MENEHKAAVPAVEKKAAEKTNLTMFLYGVCGLLGVAIIVCGALGVYFAYSKTSTGTFTYVVAKVLRLPAVKVNDKVIRYTEYVDDLKAINTLQAYDKANGGATANMTDEQKSDQVLWRLVNNILINKLAKDLDVKVEQKDIDELKKQMLAQFKSEDEAGVELMNRYGWTMAIYESKVIRPYILQSKLSDAYETNVKAREEDRAKAQGVLDQIKGGASFEEMATKYSQDATAEEGGDLGWFGKGDMVPQFEEAAFALKKGEVSPELVESPFGYHIIRVDDTKTEAGEEQIKARHIVFLFPSLNSALDQAIKDVKVHMYLRNVHNPFLQTEAAK